MKCVELFDLQSFAVCLLSIIALQGVFGLDFYAHKISWVDTEMFKFIHRFSGAIYEVFS